jgi:hypothetical protein
MNFYTRPVIVWSLQVAGLLEMAGKYAYVAGGAARQLAIDDAPPAQDIDLFLYAEDGYTPCCNALRDMGYPFVGESDNAAIYEGRDTDELAVQVIRPYRDAFSLTYGAPRDVLSCFSFTTEQFAVTADNKALFSEEGVVHTHARRLVINNITDPLQLAMRALKYAAKGYYFDQAEMHRLFVEWERRPGEWRREVAQAVA